MHSTLYFGEWDSTPRPPCAPSTYGGRDPGPRRGRSSRRPLPEDKRGSCKGGLTGPRDLPRPLLPSLPFLCPPCPCMDESDVRKAREWESVNASSFAKAAPLRDPHLVNLVPHRSSDLPH